MASSAYFLFMYKIGVIGSGVIAKKVTKILNNCGDFKITAIFSRNENSANKLAKKFDAKVFSNIDEFIKNKELYDLVYIATPHASHYEYIQICLENKIPSLVEKPIVINVKEINEVILMKEKYDTYVSEAMWTLHSDIFNSLKELVFNNNLGKLQEVEFDFSVYKPKIFKNDRIFDIKRGGGALLDIGIYLITIAYFLFKSPLSISIKTKFYRNVDLVDQITFNYSDFIINMNCSINKIKDVLKFKYDNGEIIVKNGHAPKKIILKDNVNHNIKIIKGKTTYQKEFYDAFIDLKNNKKESSFISLNDNLEVIKLMDECRKLIGLKMIND